MSANHKRCCGRRVAEPGCVYTKGASNMKPGLAARATRAVLFLLLCVTPLRAGTLYVPLAIDTQRGEVRFRTQIYVANEGTERRGFRPYFIASGSNGTQRGAPPGAVFIDSQKTAFFSGLGLEAEDVGMLELDADTDLAVSAKLSAVN